MRAALFAGHIRPGEFLGSEATLGERFNVSRMASRDALRTLEAMGIVEIRKGVKGGAWIARENPDRFADALSIQLQLIGVTADEVLDAQLAIETRASELAATRATREDLEELQRTLSACDAAKADMQAFTAASLRFHERVVQASRNRALLAQFRALRVVLQPLLEPNSTEEIAGKVIRSHSSLQRALRAGDAAKAGEVMRKRIEDVRSKLVGHAGTVPSTAATAGAAPLPQGARESIGVPAPADGATLQG